MKKLLIVLLTMMGAAAVHADDYPYLVFQTSDGTLQTISSASLTISFADGKLVATNSEGSLSIALSDLSKMYFAASATSIDSTPIAEEAGAVEVFTTTGISLGKYDSTEQAQATLGRGIYVVKSKSKTLKIAVK